MPSLLRRGIRVLSGVLAAFGMLIVVQVLRMRRVRLLPAHPGFWISHVVVPSGGGPASTRRLDLVVFGDSTTAGVGVDAVEASLPYRLAQLLADDRGHEVRVISYGWAGARVADLRGDQVPRARRPGASGRPARLQGADLVAVVAGANDATHRTRHAHFRRDLRAALDAIGTAAPRAEVVVAGIPRLRGALPHLEPLISLADAYAAPLRRIQRHEAERAGAAYADLARNVLPRLRGRIDRESAMSADGFHPGPEVYAAWAEVIAEALEAAREADEATRPRAAPSRGAGSLPPAPAGGIDD